MPNHYTGGYGGRRFGGSGVTAYQGPTNIQAQSFFNPIPIDTMTGELERRQTAFDVGYAGALAEKDLLAQQQVGMSDLADKNRIIKEGMQNIDTLVQDQYGGDWGRASKAVAGQVTAIRGHKFWNAQKEAEKRREEAREFKIKNPNAFIFNDPTNLSTLDEQGRVRAAGAFDVDMAARGDYAKTATDIMGMVEADAQAFGLQPVDVEGLSHFLQTGDRSGISEDKIRKLAANPAIQQLFLGRHGELGRIGELSEDQQRQQGVYGKTAEQFAEEQLLGAGLTRVHSKTDLKYIQDQMAIKRQTAALKQEAVPSIWGRPLTNVGETDDINTRRQRRMFDQFQKREYGTEGGIRQALKGTETGYIYSPQEWQAELKRQDQNQKQRVAKGEPGFPGYRRRRARDVQKYNDLRGLVDNLRKNNPELKDMNDQKMLESYYDDMNKYKLTFDKLLPIVNDDVSEGLGRQAMAHLESGIEFQIEGRGGTGVMDLRGKRGVSEQFNMKPAAIREYMRDEKVDYGYNYDNGMFYVELPEYEGMQSTYDPEKAPIGFKKLYFSPDDATIAASNSIQGLEQSLIHDEDFDQRTPLGQSANGNNLEMELSYAGTGEKRIGGDVTNDPVINMTVYEIDAYGNQTVATVDGTTARQAQISLGQVKQILAGYQERTLKNFVRTEY